MTRYEETVAERPLEEHIGEVWRPSVGSYEEVMMYVRENIDEARHIKGFSLAFNSFFRLSHIENPDVYSDEMLGYMAGELLKLCENNFKFYLRTLRYLPTSDIRFSYPVEDMVKYALKGIAIKYPGVSPVNILEDFAKVESTECFKK
ncbi:hypothetical protein KXD40_006451 [Peronospora effusa]|nr:hypothetical protein KXD40_006451 [Peronospora effusa]